MGWRVLKKRIIPLLLWSNKRLVKTTQFSSPRIVGDPIKTCRVYSDQDSDEIVLLKIGPKAENVEAFIADVRRLSHEIMMPITVGGGITDSKVAHDFFDAGADKVLINTVGYSNLPLVESLVETFGSQAIMAGLDFRKNDGAAVLVSNNGNAEEAINLQDHLKRLQNAGIGELLIQSVDRDGTRTGYDLDTLSEVLSLTNVPFIAAGGAGSFSQLLDAFQLGVDGVACGSLFNFGDNNPIRAKAYLRNYGLALKATS